MSNRITLADIAKAAGVSPVTVDRVLNARGRVKEATAERVLDAARQLQYHGVSLFERRIKQLKPHVKLGVMLHKPKQAFYQQFKTTLTDICRHAFADKVAIEVAFATDEDAQSKADCLLSLGERVDVIAAVAMDHYLIQTAVQRLQANGIPTIALLSDFAAGSRYCYLGTDNRKVGRTVAQLLTWQQTSGEVVVFVGGHNWQGHELRESGFRSYLREHAPDIKIIDTQVNLDTRAQTEAALSHLLDTRPELKAAYIAGGGVEGAISAIRQRKDCKLKLCVNELTDLTRSALKDGSATVATVTPIDQISMDLLEMASNFHLNENTGAQDRWFPPQFYFSEML